MPESFIEMLQDFTMLMVMMSMITMMNLMEKLHVNAAGCNHDQKFHNMRFNGSSKNYERVHDHYQYKNQ